MRSTINIQTGILFTIILVISIACAQQGGGALIGGDKDESPPVILESTPENYSTNFTGQDYEFVFDEYFELKDIKQKLLISPPMEEQPEIKIKGKKLLIHFISPLLPDRTYTLNFDDALVDRNESNPLENFQVVFSTGNEIDSLEIYGKVNDAYTGEAVKGVAVMLYANKTQDAGHKMEEKDSTSNLSPLVRGDTGGYVVQDSLPLTSLPLYFTRTDEEGKYHLQNLAEGDYKLFALLDGNNNYLFDLPTESIAFVDTLVKGKAKIQDSRPMIQDSLPKIEEDSLQKIQDTIINIQEEVIEEPDSTLNQQPATRNSQPETHNPDSLFLLLFKESYQNQYINGTERKRADKLQITFNQPLDSIDLNILDTDDFADKYLMEWSTTKDTIICWLVDSLLSRRDSISFSIGYTGYDSLEQKTWEIDTLRFDFKHSSEQPEEQNPMSLKSNVKNTMELGIPMLLSSGLPYQTIDTSRISLFRKRDSLEFPESFDIKPIVNTTEIPGLSKSMSILKQVSIEKVFLQDSSYSLRILPGAVKGYFGDTNDSLNVNFRVNTEDKYGILVLNLDSLNEPAILQLLDSKENLIQNRHIRESTTERFTMLSPGKYIFKLILDKNQNRKWDTGRYLKNIQPEPILLYNKEIELKAKWEMEENWIINNNP